MLERISRLVPAIISTANEAGLGGSTGCTSNWSSGGCGFKLSWVGNILLLEIDYEIFSMVISSLPLIQEGQLSILAKEAPWLVHHRLGFLIGSARVKSSMLILENRLQSRTQRSVWDYNTVSEELCLCWGFMAQSTHWGHVGRTTFENNWRRGHVTLLEQKFDATCHNLVCVLPDLTSCLIIFVLLFKQFDYFYYFILCYLLIAENWHPGQTPLNIGRM